MNFKQAKDKLKELAKGKYHSMRYSITETQHGNLGQECEIYIDGTTWFYGSSWDEVFESLEKSTRRPEPISEVEPIEELRQAIGDS